MTRKLTAAILCLAGVLGSTTFVRAENEPIPMRSMDPVGAVGLNVKRPALDASCTRINACTSTRLLNGEAWVGDNQIWETDFAANMIDLFDLATCQIVRRCPAPGGNLPSELTVLGGVLYHYDFGTGLIYGINPGTCQVVSTCDPPGDDLAEGLASDGTYLYKGDSQFIYRFLPPSAAGAGCTAVAQCLNPPGDSADGLTLCNDQLIMLGYSGSMYRIQFDTGVITGSCQLNLGADGNGITSDRTGRLWADNVNGDIDAVDVGCSIPVPVAPTTWSGIKTLYR